MTEVEDRAARLEKALAAIDAANAEDPNREEHEGQSYPRELLYSRRMSDWLDRLAADETPSEALQLAVRAQHLCRFRMPRGDYPMTRQGYLEWRNACKEMHASLADEILDRQGYDRQTIARVRDLILKKRFKADPEAQRLEDVACVVFLENYFASFSEQHDEEKVVNILRKTWKKMSPVGHRAALELDMDPRLATLVTRALEPPTGRSRVWSGRPRSTSATRSRPPWFAGAP